MARRGKNTLVAGIEDDDLSNTAIAQTSQKTAGSPGQSANIGYVCDHGDAVEHFACGLAEISKSQRPSARRRLWQVSGGRFEG